MWVHEKERETVSERDRERKKERMLKKMESALIC